MLGSLQDETRSSSARDMNGNSRILTDLGPDSSDPENFPNLAEDCVNGQKENLVLHNSWSCLVPDLVSLGPKYSTSEMDTSTCGTGLWEVNEC